MPTIAAVSIYVDDLDAAADFYTRHLGFTIASRPAPVIVELGHEGASLVLCAAERPARLDYPAASGTVIGLGIDDVAGAAARLRGAGIDLVFDEPQDFPGGRFIAVRDPAGNVIELLEFGS